MLWIISALLFLSAHGQIPQKVTNIDYLGSGYDILIGNPYNNLFDPGFRGEVLELAYTQVKDFCFTPTF